MNHPPTRSHNYQTKLMQMVKAGQIPAEAPAGSANLVNVAHDEWCDIYRGGFCNCNPAIEIRHIAKEVIESV